MVGLGLVAVALLATRSAASEKLVAAAAQPEQLASTVAEKQVAARRAIEASKKLTAAHGDREVVMASARIPAAGELLTTPPAKPAAKVRTIKMVVTAYRSVHQVLREERPGHHRQRQAGVAQQRPVRGRRHEAPAVRQEAGHPQVPRGDGLRRGARHRRRAIKGNRPDVYFPSHQKALEWGRQSLDVTVID